MHTMSRHLIIAFSLCGSLAHAQDYFNVNLYGYGSTTPGHAFAEPAAQETVKIAPGATAGAPGFASAGWQNVMAAQATTEITSTGGAKAQFNLTKRRNSSPYHWTRTRDAATHNNPNAALLDGKTHGTFDPGDGSLHSVFEITAIPFAAYDVAVYLGINQAQTGNARGTIRINGGDEQPFTLIATEPDGTFTEITDPKKPGNYLVFRGLSSPSLHIETRGDGFNHLGPAGFQIVQADRAREPLAITDFKYNTQTNQVTLTWTSFPGDKYGIFWSPNLEEYRPVIHAAYPAHATATRTTYTFPSPARGVTRESFKIGPPDLAPPQLERIWGNNRTIHLTFSEPLTPAQALKPENYRIAKSDGGTATVTAAAFHADRKTVVLTTAAPLDLDATYTVAMENLTDFARRPLDGGTPATFRTWDDNPKGVKVFILAGQSNMVGRGSVENGHDRVPGAIGSLRHKAVTDPAKYSRLLEDPSTPATSPWRVRDDVRLWWNRTDSFGEKRVQKENLGDGLAGKSFGPEYGFGWQVGEHFDPPVLIIKAAWGGKSLYHDFRPPSAAAARGGEPGHYYLLMIEQVRQALDNFDTEFPEWAGLGYQIAGFGWHQGWNDAMHQKPADEYETNLADFINDLRAEFGQPKLPFAIAATGHGGANQKNPFSTVLAAQLAVADPRRHPAFAGSVFSVDTRPFWREPDVSPVNDGSHWHANGESYFLIGDSIGQGMVEMLKRN
jgi:alpha-galactosidase